MSAVQQVLRRRRQRRLRALQSQAYHEMQGQATPHHLLSDLDLVRSTRMARVEFDTNQDASAVARDALRHDYCVLLCQQEVFHSTHHHVQPLSSADLIVSGPSYSLAETGTTATAESPVQPSLDRAVSAGTAGSKYKTLKAEQNRSDVILKYIAGGSWQLEEPTPEDKLANRSLCFLSVTNSFRLHCIWLIKQWWFDAVVLLLILINSCLMIVDLEVPEKPQALQKVIAICEELFLYLFTLEAVVKIVALGLICHPNSYLRDNWNKLDMLVVCAGWFSLIYNQLGTCKFHGLIFCAEGSQAAGTTNYGSLRTVRILRPLRTINRFPSMRKLVQAILVSLPQLLDSVVLFTFVLILFGTIGVQLYSGIFLRACVDPLTGAPQSLDSFCQLGSTSSGTWGGCQEGFECRADAGANPNGGVTSFDHLGYAALAVLQIITLEGWTDIMRDVRDAKGLINDLFFIMLVLFGAFFMMNLVVAVLVENFDSVASSDQPALQAALNKRSSHMGGNPEENWARELKHVEASIQGRVASHPCIHCCCMPLRRRSLQLVSSPLFNNVVLLLIIGNTVVLALDNVLEESVLETLNYIFSSIFLLEMIIKLVGLGPVLYCKDAYNIFDAIVVVVSVVETILQLAGNSGLVHLTVLRTFRLMRVFKLARRMRSLAKVLNTIWASLIQIRDLGLLMLVFTVVCALLGMSVFPCSQADLGSPNAKWGFIQDGPNQGKLVRPNFSNFFYAMVTTFVLLTGENWNEIMFIAVQNNSWMSALYFVVVVVFGNYIILNLFLAILIDNFDNIEKQEEEMRESQDLSQFQQPTSVVIAEPGGDVENGNLHCEEGQADVIAYPSECGMSVQTSPGGHKMVRMNSQTEMRKPRATVKDLTNMHGLVGNSLFLFGPGSWLRNLLWKVVTHQFFDQLFYGLIVVSAVALALDTPEQDHPEVKKFVRAMDYVLTVFFTLEALAKIIVYGFCWGKDCYLHDVWNVLDFFVVVTAIGNLILVETKAVIGVSSSGLAWLKALRAVRALRPLRMVSRNEGMRAVVNSILLAIPAIGEVLMVLILFLCIFSILGVQFFKNRLSRCSCMEWCPSMRFNPAGSSAVGKPIEELCQGSCMAAPAHARECVWERHPQYSFDNSIYAMLALFEVSTLEMWPDAMWLAVDSTSKDEGPLYDHRPYAVLFFVIFIFVMAFFIVNLFVGTVIDKFTMVRNEMNGLLILTQRQQNWIRTQKMMLRLRPRPLLTPPNDKWRQLVLQLVSLHEFEVIVMGIIIVNIVVMCTYHHGASPGVERAQENANYVFLGCFVLEAVLKLYAMRWRLYFRDTWNCFDFFVLIVSLATESSVLNNLVPIDATMLRILRAARMFRLVKSFKSLRKLFTTLVASLPSLVNVGATLLLLFYVYAIAGMALFGDIKVDNNPYIKYMGKDVNFRSFYLTMVMLFRMTTGESWNGIMHECFSGAMCEDPPHARKCGSTVAALIFFISFMLLGTFVFLNLFIAVIIQNLFETEVDDNEDIGFLTLKPDDLDDFVEAWSRIAPDGSWYIPTGNLEQLLSAISPPLGFGKAGGLKSRMVRVLDGIGMHDFNGRVHFAETLWLLAAMVDGEAMLGQAANFEVQRNLNKAVTRFLPLPTRSMAMGCSFLYTASDAYAALSVQKVWRAKMARRKLENDGVAMPGTTAAAVLALANAMHFSRNSSPCARIPPLEHRALAEFPSDNVAESQPQSSFQQSETNLVPDSGGVFNELHPFADGPSRLRQVVEDTLHTNKVRHSPPLPLVHGRLFGTLRCIDCTGERFACVCGTVCMKEREPDIALVAVRAEPQESPVVANNLPDQLTNDETSVSEAIEAIPEEGSASRDVSRSVRTPSDSKIYDDHQDGPGQLLIKSCFGERQVYLT